MNNVEIPFQEVMNKLAMQVTNQAVKIASLEAYIDIMEKQLRELGLEHLAIHEAHDHNGTQETHDHKES